MDEEFSLKQRRFIKAYIQTGNATQAAKDAGYECKTDAAFAEMGSRLVRNVEGRISKIMGEIGLDDAMLAQKALAGLNAMVVKPFARDGVVTSEPAYIDFPTRAKYLEIVSKMKGLLKEEDVVGRGVIDFPVDWDSMPNQQRLWEYLAIVRRRCRNCSSRCFCIKYGSIWVTDDTERERA